MFTVGVNTALSANSARNGPTSVTEATPSMPNVAPVGAAESVVVLTFVVTANGAATPG